MVFEETEFWGKKLGLKQYRALNLRFRIHGA